jgi:hypothetical protein
MWSNLIPEAIQALAGFPFHACPGSPSLTLCICVGLSFPIQVSQEAESLLLGAIAPVPTYCVGIIAAYISVE